ncbi:MAG: hypothetical protein KatS3mg015_2020 [Fimbriimonadales bacterium]|nr:MAG: hypothetical protein KatS3mg015_2020 [Fimbriimonadales bacterium]
MQQRLVRAVCWLVASLAACACNRSGLPPVAAAPRVTPPEGWIEVDLSQYGLMCHMPGYTRKETDDPTLVFRGEHYVCETPTALYVITVGKDDVETPGDLTADEIKRELEIAGAKIESINTLRIQGLNALEARYSITYEDMPGAEIHVIERMCKRGPAYYSFAVYGPKDIYEAPDTVAFFTNIRLIN